MTNSTHALSTHVVLEFCELCNWVYGVWLNHRELFDNNQRATELMMSSGREEWARLAIISQEYSLLQIRKLHDKADVNGNCNVGIDYVLEYGDWSDSVRPRLEELKRKLDDFGIHLRHARNKILSQRSLHDPGRGYAGRILQWR